MWIALENSWSFLLLLWLLESLKTNWDAPPLVSLPSDWNFHTNKEQEAEATRRFHGSAWSRWNTVDSIWRIKRAIELHGLGPSSAAAVLYVFSCNVQKTRKSWNQEKKRARAGGGEEALGNNPDKCFSPSNPSSCSVDNFGHVSVCILMVGNDLGLSFQCFLRSAFQYVYPLTVGLESDIEGC